MFPTAQEDHPSSASHTPSLEPSGGGSPGSAQLSPKSLSSFEAGAFTSRIPYTSLPLYSFITFHFLGTGHPLFLARSHLRVLCSPTLLCNGLFFSQLSPHPCPVMEFCLLWETTRGSLCPVLWVEFG